jgi:hypothetical protein
MGHPRTETAGRAVLKLCSTGNDRALQQPTRHVKRTGGTRKRPGKPGLLGKLLVGARGFEPPTPRSRTESQFADLPNEQALRRDGMPTDAYSGVPIQRTQPPQLCLETHHRRLCPPSPPGAHSTRLSFYWGTCPSRRRNGTSGANRSCATPSTTRSASSRNVSRNVNAEGGACADFGGPPSAARRRPLGRLSFHEEATGGGIPKHYATTRGYSANDAQLRASST